MVTCSVVGCGATQRNKPENITFHRFPLDPVTREKWVRLIGRVGWSPKKNSAVCSKHFPEKYLKKNRFYTILIKGAIPTFDVPGKLKERLVTSYIYRDITPPPSPQDRETKELSLTNQKLLSRIDTLKQKLRDKVKKIHALREKTTRQAKTIVTLQSALKIIRSRPELKDHNADIIILCTDEQDLHNVFNI